MTTARVHLRIEREGLRLTTFVRACDRWYVSTADDVTTLADVTCRRCLHTWHAGKLAEEPA